MLMMCNLKQRGTQKEQCKNLNKQLHHLKHRKKIKMKMMDLQLLSNKLKKNTILLKGKTMMTYMLMNNRLTQMRNNLRQCFYRI